MMKVYKLTDEKDQTHGDMQWGEGVKHSAKASGYILCSGSLIHAYRDPLLAIFCNRIHGDYDLETAHLWECETKCRRIEDDRLKIGMKSLTTIKQIPLPVITTEQRVEIAIRIALEDYDEASFVNWAHGWINNTDRSEGTARGAAWAARAARAAWAAAWAARAAWAAAWAAARAAEAAWAAAWAAARAAEAAWAAAWAAARAARAAEWAAEAAAKASGIDILPIIKSVVDKKEE